MLATIMLVTTCDTQEQAERVHAALLPLCVNYYKYEPRLDGCTVTLQLYPSETHLRRPELVAHLLHQLAMDVQ